MLMNSKCFFVAIPVTNTTSTTISNSCPRCGAQFKMIEALRSHMCVSTQFCRYYMCLVI